MGAGLAEVAIGDDDWEHSPEGIAESRAIAEGIKAAQNFANKDIARRVGGLSLHMMDVGRNPGVRLGTRPWLAHRGVFGRFVVGHSQMPRLEQGGDGRTYGFS